MQRFCEPFPAPRCCYLLLSANTVYFTIVQGAEGIAQSVECLPGEHKDMSLIPSSPMVQWCVLVIPARERQRLSDLKCVHIYTNVKHTYHKTYHLNHMWHCVVISTSHPQIPSRNKTGILTKYLHFLSTSPSHGHPSSTSHLYSYIMGGGLCRICPHKKTDLFCHSVSLQASSI